MKVGVITLMTALLFALPALAGTDVCPPPDSDGDGTNDVCDNCSSDVNAGQEDSDSDGYGNFCDADFNQNGIVDGADFGLLGQYWGQATPPVGTAPPAIDMNSNAIVDGADFGRLGATWGQLPGPSCGNPQGTPCP